MLLDLRALCSRLPMDRALDVSAGTGPTLPHPAARLSCTYLHDCDIQLLRGALKR
jgi:hypothetical protein